MCSIQQPDWYLPESLYQHPRFGFRLYLYVEDAANAIALAVTDQEVCGVYNLGTGKAYEVRHVVKEIAALIDPSIVLDFGALPYRPDQVMHLQASILRLQKATGWKAKIDLSEGLRLTEAQKQ